MISSKRDWGRRQSKEALGENATPLYLIKRERVASLILFGGVPSCLTQEEHINAFAYCQETTAQIRKEVAVDKGRRESKGEHLSVPAR